MTTPLPSPAAETQRPWTLDMHDGERLLVCDAEGCVVAKVDLRSFNEQEDGLKVAHLVTAAPDLRDALQSTQASLDELLDYSGGADNALADPYVVERAQAAVASARSVLAAADR